MKYLLDEELIFNCIDFIAFFSYSTWQTTIKFNTGRNKNKRDNNPGQKEPIL